jgi:hypothetical protein
MVLDKDSRKQLQQFWRKRFLLGLGIVGVAGLGLWRMTTLQAKYDALQIVESRDLPEQFYQQMVAAIRRANSQPPRRPSSQDSKEYANASACQAMEALGILQDARAIPELGTVLQTDLNRTKSCQMSRSFISDDSQSNSIYTNAAKALGEFPQAEATEYLKAAAAKPPTPEVLNLWEDFFYKLDRLPQQRAQDYQNYIATKQRNAVLKALQQSHAIIDEEVQKIFIQVLRDPNTALTESNRGRTDDAKEIAIDILKDFTNEPRVEFALIQLFQDEKSSDRSLAIIAQSLVKNKPTDRVLDALLLESVRAGRISMVMAFAGINPNRSTIIPELVKYLNRETTHSHISIARVQTSAAIALGMIDDPRSVAALTQALQQPSQIIYPLRTQFNHPDTLQAVPALRQAWQNLSMAPEWDLRDLARLPKVQAASPNSFHDPQLTVPEILDRLVRGNKYYDETSQLTALAEMVDRPYAFDAVDAKTTILSLMKKYKSLGSDHRLVNQARIAKTLDFLGQRIATDRAAQDRIYQLWRIEQVLLAGLGFTGLLLILFSLRLRSPFPIAWSGYLIFPEEIVAELIALKQLRQAQSVPMRRIQLELAYEICLLLWAVHIRIRLENLRLPPGGNDRAK